MMEDISEKSEKIPNILINLLQNQPAFTQAWYTCTSSLSKWNSSLLKLRGQVTFKEEMITKKEGRVI
jgi:hypothetical protein